MTDDDAHDAHDASDTGTTIQYSVNAEEASVPSILLIGGGHVFDLSEQLRLRMNAFEPDVLALELDDLRFTALMEERTRKEAGEGKEGQPKRRIPLTVRILSRAQKRIADMFGNMAGSEMLAAYDIAKEREIPVAFIDLDARIIYRRLLGGMSRWEKIKLFFGALGGLFIRKKRVEAEMQRYQESPEAFLNDLERTFPGARKVLIDDRNIIMSKRIITLGERFDRIAVLVGDGHVPGISELISSLDLEVVRLSELRSVTPNEAVRHSEPKTRTPREKTKR